jgi:hypothetical protein
MYFPTLTSRLSLIQDAAVTAAVTPTQIQKCPFPTAAEVMPLKQDPTSFTHIAGCNCSHCWQAIYQFVNDGYVLVCFVGVIKVFGEQLNP